MSPIIEISTVTSYNYIIITMLCAENVLSKISCHMSCSTTDYALIARLKVAL